MKRTISYSSGQCGAGKTFQMCERSREIVRREGKVLLIQPTKLLADKTAQQEFRQRPNCPLVTVFHGDAVGPGVSHRLANYLADPQDEPQVVIATHQALPLLTHRTNLSDWHLMVDECPQVDRCENLILPETHELITKHVSLVPEDDAAYGRIIVENREPLKEIARNRYNDALWKKLQETTRILLNPYWDVWVKVGEFEKLQAGQGTDLTFFSMMNPSLVSGFKSVFMAGANFEDSGVFRWWDRQGILWKEDHEFAKRLQYQQHRNGYLATVYYATEADWSANKRDTIVDGVSHGDRLRDAANVILDAANPLWVANNKVRSDKFFKGTRLPNNPLGLNDYSSEDQLAFFSALNRTPAHSKFLESRGITRKQVSRMGYCETVYQTAMRTSLRDEKSTNPKKIVVPDRRAADFLCEKLVGAKPEKIEAGIPDTGRKSGRPRIHEDNAAKSRSRREQQKEKKRTMVLEMINLSDLVAAQDHNDVAERRIETPLDYKDHFDTQLPCTATIFTRKNSPQPLWYVYCENFSAFVYAMRHDFETNSFPTKEENSLISPAVFDPNRVVLDKFGKRKRKARGNIVYLQNIMLDFEKGDLTPEQFAGIFPNLQMVITNTWNHTKELPRFRVFIPTTRPMTPDVYETIFDEIAKRLADRGYCRTPGKKSNYLKSGLDHRKRTATSVFYLPCQAQKSEDSFFDVYLDPERKPLDPAEWFDAADLPEKVVREPVPIQPLQGEYDQARLESAVHRWRYETPPGQGNHCFYLFAVELNKMGMTDSDIETKLKEEAYYGRHPAERRAQIPSIMDSLAKWSSTETA